jgi:hypothetical protein
MRNRSVSTIYFKFIFLRENVGKIRVAGCYCSITTTGKDFVQYGIENVKPELKRIEKLKQKTYSIAQ